MKNLRNTIATATLAATILFGSTFANAGIMLSEFATRDEGTAQCKESSDSKDLTGILLSDLTGILLSDFTGILLSDFASKDGDETPVNCGILITG